MCLAFRMYTSSLIYSENCILSHMITGLEDNCNVIWNPVFRRLRCNGHIINLSAQSFLFPDIKDVDEEEALEQITGQLPKEFNNAQMEEWRRKGPLGKIHNISVFITLS